MLHLRSVLRCSCRSSRFLSSSQAAAPRINVEALKKLRKLTGYSFVNCQKALAQFGPDRFNDAQKWLEELAAKEGWTKAAKLSNRQVKNGLLSVLAQGNAAAVIELNCETDFVARGEYFKNLVVDITRSLHETAQSDLTSVSKAFELRTKEVESICVERRSLKEVLAMAVGKLGENICVARAQVILSQPEVTLVGYAHPRAENAEVVPMGKFVSVVGLRRPNPSAFSTENLGVQICQHIVGMKPESVGTPFAEGETPSAASDDEAVKKEHNEGDELNDFCEEKGTVLSEEETTLLRQSFMLNPSQTVFDYVSSHGGEIVDFYRTELGAGASRDQ